MSRQRWDRAAEPSAADGPGTHHVLSLGVLVVYLGAACSELLVDDDAVDVDVGLLGGLEGEGEEHGGQVAVAVEARCVLR